MKRQNDDDEGHTPVLNNEKYWAPLCEPLYQFLETPRSWGELEMWQVKQRLLANRLKHMLAWLCFKQMTYAECVNEILGVYIWRHRFPADDAKELRDSVKTKAEHADERKLTGRKTRGPRKYVPKRVSKKWKNAENAPAGATIVSRSPVTRAWTGKVLARKA